MIKVGFKRLSDGAIIPTKAHQSDSGFDLFASEDVIIEPGETVIVPTGIAVELSAGYEAQGRPRSGVTAKSKLRVQLGTIDNGYMGEIGVIVDKITDDPIGNTSRYLNFVDGSEIRQDEDIPDGTYYIRKGDKLAQLVVQPLPAVEAYEVEGDLEETERGEGGFGSSGVREDD